MPGGRFKLRLERSSMILAGITPECAAISFRATMRIRGTNNDNAAMYSLKRLFDTSWQRKILASCHSSGLCYRLGAITDAAGAHYALVGAPA